MKPTLMIDDIPFYDTPPEVEGSPYWVDLWSDVKGHKIGLQIKPQSYNSPSVSLYMGKAKSSEKSGHKQFEIDYDGKVFEVVIENGKVPASMRKRIVAYRNLLLKF